VLTTLENLENSGNLRILEISGKTQGISILLREKYQSLFRVFPHNSLLFNLFTHFPVLQCEAYNRMKHVGLLGYSGTDVNC